MNQTQVPPTKAWYNELVRDGPIVHIDKLLKDPLGSGYLFRFCRSQFCAENLAVLLEIEKFMDYFSLDNNTWDPEKTCCEIDAESGIMNEDEVPRERLQLFITPGSFVSQEVWPSGKVKLDTVIELLRNIWARFFDDSSLEQICLPCSVVKNTAKRVRNVHVYGKEVFGEVLNDSGVKNAKMDIAKRFGASEDYKTYLAHLQDLQTPSCASGIFIPPPSSSLTAVYTKMQLEDNRNPVEITLEMIMTDRTLYVIFMKHLAHAVCSEHLRFLRALTIFKRRMTQAPNDPMVLEKASEWAFIIYLSFIVEGSAYEICITANTRKEIGRRIAIPAIDMFKEAERSTMSTLRAQFEAFKQTNEYKTMRVKLVQNYDSLSTLPAHSGRQRISEEDPPSESSKMSAFPLLAKHRLCGGLAQQERRISNAASYLSSRDAAAQIAHSQVNPLTGLPTLQTLMTSTSVGALLPNINATVPGSRPSSSHGVVHIPLNPSHVSFPNAPSSSTTTSTPRSFRHTAPAPSPRATPGSMRAGTPLDCVVANTQVAPGGGLQMGHSPHGSFRIPGGVASTGNSASKEERNSVRRKGSMGSGSNIPMPTIHADQ